MKTGRVQRIVKVLLKQAQEVAAVQKSVGAECSSLIDERALLKLVEHGWQVRNVLKLGFVLVSGTFSSLKVRISPGIFSVGNCLF